MIDVTNPRWRCGYFAAATVFVLLLLILCGARAHASQCDAAPYGDTQQNFAAVLEAAQRTKSMDKTVRSLVLAEMLGTLMLACEAKFNRGDRSLFYQNGISDHDIDTNGPAALTSAFLTARNKALASEELGEQPSDCSRPPYRDTVAKFKAFTAKYQATDATSLIGVLEVTCRAKFDGGSRRALYTVGLTDQEIATSSTTTLASIWMDATLKALGAAPPVGDAGSARRSKSAEDYQIVSVRDLVIDGPKLAAAHALVKVTGSYVLQGNVGMLYPDMQAVMMPRYGGQMGRQPSIPILTDNSSHELREALVSCDSDPSAAQVGCQVEIQGEVTMCSVTNGFGANSRAPCIDAKDMSRWGSRSSGKAQAFANSIPAAVPSARSASAVTQAEVDALAGPMIDIPGGVFRMGDTVGTGELNEKPPHEVTIKDFWLGRTEVTRGQFQRFVTATNYRTEAERDVGNIGCVTLDVTTAQFNYRSGFSWRDVGFDQTDEHPVACVSWNDANAFIMWINNETGRHFRMPSEAEWEYAARAGSTTIYPWGVDANKGCRYANGADQTPWVDRTGRSLKAPWPFRSPARWEDRMECNDFYFYTAPVGTYQPNDFGLNDIIGNVWEWTEDCYHEDYAGAPTDGSAWISGDCPRRVFRGGAWSSLPASLRVSTRRGGETSGRADTVGFRLAQDP